MFGVFGIIKTELRHFVNAMLQLSNDTTILLMVVTAIVVITLKRWFRCFRSIKFRIWKFTLIGLIGNRLKFRLWTSTKPHGKKRTANIISLNRFHRTFNIRQCPQHSLWQNPTNVSLQWCSTKAFTSLSWLPITMSLFKGFWFKRLFSHRQTPFWLALIISPDSRLRSSFLFLNYIKSRTSMPIRIFGKEVIRKNWTFSDLLQNLKFRWSACY